MKLELTLDIKSQEVADKVRKTLDEAYKQEFPTYLPFYGSDFAVMSGSYTPWERDTFTLEAQEIIKVEESPKAKYILTDFSTVGEAVQAVFDSKEEYFYNAGGSPCNYVVAEYQDAGWYWKESNLYKKTHVEWYDNIPESGVLCWVADLKEGLMAHHISRVTNKTDDGRFEATVCYWKHAVPLTKDELKAYLDNAPK